MDQNLRSETVRIIDKHARAVEGREMLYGVDDCAQWVSGIVSELTHGRINLAKPFGAYAGQKGAYAALRIYSDVPGGDILDCALKRAREIGLPRLYVGGIGAQDGFPTVDVGVVATHLGPALAVRRKGNWLVRSEDGIAAMPLSAAVCAWAVYL